MPTVQSPTNSASAAAVNDINVANLLVKRYLENKNNGGKANPPTGAVAFTGTEYLAALGTANQTILDAIAVANPQ